MAWFRIQCACGTTLRVDDDHDRADVSCWSCRAAVMIPRRAFERHRRLGLRRKVVALANPQATTTTQALWLFAVALTVASMVPYLRWPLMALVAVGAAIFEIHVMRFYVSAAEPAFAESRAGRSFGRLAAVSLVASLWLVAVGVAIWKGLDPSSRELQVADGTPLAASLLASLVLPVSFRSAFADGPRSPWNPFQIVREIGRRPAYYGMWLGMLLLTTLVIETFVGVSCSSLGLVHHVQGQFPETFQWLSWLQGLSQGRPLTLSLIGRVAHLIDRTSIGIDPQDIIKAMAEVGVMVIAYYVGLQAITRMTESVGRQCA